MNAEPERTEALTLVIEHHRHYVTRSAHDAFRLTRVVTRTEIADYELGADHDKAVATALHLLAYHRFGPLSCLDPGKLACHYLTVPQFCDGRPNTDPDDWHHLEAKLLGRFTQDDRIRIYNRLENARAES